MTTGSSVPPKTSEQSPPDPNVIVPITWKDLDIGMEPDAKFESWMLTSKAKACLNRKVRITGFMHGGVYSAEKIRTFFLKCELECPFGAGGQAHHHIEVELQGKLRTPFRTNSLTVEGLLTLRPHEGPDGATWWLLSPRRDQNRMTPAPSRRLQVSALLCLLAGCEPQTMPVISPPGPLPENSNSSNIPHSAGGIRRTCNSLP